MSISYFLTECNVMTLSVHERIVFAMKFSQVTKTTLNSTGLERERKKSAFFLKWRQ